ncbi:MAG: glycosyltransferase, partial [Actinobacteria bacterium]|nr:glycosyltransferase [Actinomycetota bacterium]
MTISADGVRAKRQAYVVTGGGTAGHVLPGLAVADALVAKGVDPKLIHYVGSRRGFEVKALALSPYPFLALPGRGIRRSFHPVAIFENLFALIGLGVAVLHALISLGRWRPRVVVSLGGYAAFPASLAAVMLRRPLVLVNVDAVAGAVNRLMARFAVASAVALP